MENKPQIIVNLEFLRIDSLPERKGAGKFHNSGPSLIVPSGPEVKNPKAIAEIVLFTGNPDFFYKEMRFLHLLFIRRGGDLNSRGAEAPVAFEATAFPG